jgi:hypothetical protein
MTFTTVFNPLDVYGPETVDRRKSAAGAVALAHLGRHRQPRVQFHRVAVQ